MAELLGSIDDAVARHAQVVSESIAEPVAHRLPQVPVAPVVPPAAPARAPERLVEPVIEPVVEPVAAPVVAPTRVEPGPFEFVVPAVRESPGIRWVDDTGEQALTPSTDPVPTPSTTASQAHRPVTWDRTDPSAERPVEVPSGRDWDAELARSAKLAPLMDRALGVSGVVARVPEDVDPWASEDLSDPHLPTDHGDALWAATDVSAHVVAAHVVADDAPAHGLDRPVVSLADLTGGTPIWTADDVSPASTGPLTADVADQTEAERASVAAQIAALRDAAPVPVDPAPAAPVLAAGPTQVIEPARDITGEVPHLHADPGGAVVGEFVELLAIGDIQLSNDPMAVPIRPAASPVVEVARSAPAQRNGKRRGKRGTTSPVPVRYPGQPVRHHWGIVRRTVSVLVVLACLAGVGVGGMMAVQRFVLAKRWPVSLQPVSQFIEQRTGHEFTRAVPVVELSADDFDARVSEVRLGLPIEGIAADDSVADVMASSRALGLWSGPYNATAAARTVARSWPAVYDPATHTVYVDGSVTDGDRRKAFVARELTLALFDQSFEWSSLLEGATGGEAMAYRTRLEAEALDVASAYKAQLDGRSTREVEDASTLRLPKVDEKAWAAVPDSLEISVRIPLQAGSSLATGQVDDLAALVGGDQELMFSTSAISDPPDLPDLVEGDVVAAGLGPQGPQGASYWLTVLQSRIDPTDARAVLDGYRADDVRTVLSDADRDGTADRVCVDAALRAGDRPAAKALEAVMQQWAVAGPVQSSAAVARIKDVVFVRSCDPGIEVTTANRPSAAFDTLYLALTQAAATADGG